MKMNICARKIVGAGKNRWHTEKGVGACDKTDGTRGNAVARQKNVGFCAKIFRNFLKMKIPQNLTRKLYFFKCKNCVSER